MSALRREFINLNVNGQHLKPIPDIQCVNGGAARAQHSKRSWESVFLICVIVAQTICTVVGFIVFAYFVDKKLEAERTTMEGQLLLYWRQTNESMQRLEHQNCAQLSAKVSTQGVLIEGQGNIATKLEADLRGLVVEIDGLRNATKTQQLYLQRLEEEIEAVRSDAKRQQLRQPRMGDRMAPFQVPQEKQSVDSQNASNSGDQRGRSTAARDTLHQLQLNDGYNFLAAKIDNLEKSNEGAKLHSYQQMSDKIKQLDEEIENLKKNKGTPRGLPLQGSETEFNRVVEVDSIHEFPEIENVDYRDMEDEEEYDSEEYQSVLKIPATIGNSSSTLASPDLSSDRLQQLDPETQLPPDLQLKVLEKQQQQAAASAARNQSAQANPPKSNALQRPESGNLDATKLTDEDPDLPIPRLAKPKAAKDSDFLRWNTDREDDQSSDKHGIKLNRRKRGAKPVQDQGQPMMNSISPRPLFMDSRTTGTLQELNGWPAAHFDSHNVSRSKKSNTPSGSTDCSSEEKNNTKKWKYPEISGSEHFDLINYENITIKREGLYFVYSQIYFYQDKSIFGYFIKKKNQSVLQCSIHSAPNRPPSGTGTTCFTAGLVYLNTNDILQLELYNDSGRCVRWGPGKSFIGLFKLPQDFSSFQ